MALYLLESSHHPLAFSQAQLPGTNRTMPDDSQTPRYLQLMQLTLKIFWSIIMYSKATFFVLLVYSKWSLVLLCQSLVREMLILAGISSSFDRLLCLFMPKIELEHDQTPIKLPPFWTRMCWRMLKEEHVEWVIAALTMPSCKWSGSPLRWHLHCHVQSRRLDRPACGQIGENIRKQSGMIVVSGWYVIVALALLEQQGSSNLFSSTKQNTIKHTPEVQWWQAAGKIRWAKDPKGP